MARIKQSLPQSVYSVGLGALNGLIYALIAESIRVWAARELQTHPYDGPDFFSFVTPIWDQNAITICVLVFATVSHLMHPYWNPRSSLIRLWLLVGIISMLAAVPLHTVSAHVLSGDIYLNPWVKLVSALAIVIPINFVFGLIIRASRKVHSPAEAS